MIVSNDGANTIAALLERGVVTVVPVTSNTDVIHPFQVMLEAASTGLNLDSKAQAEQIRSVDVRRIGSLVRQGATRPSWHRSTTPCACTSNSDSRRTLTCR